LGNKAIYAYAWDIAEAGVDWTVGRFHSIGLDTVTLAASYHAGKFLRPHGLNGKVYFPEDGTIYFRSDPRRYGVIKPEENSLLQDRDILKELIADGRMRTNAWLVLLHNTRLGSIHPDSVVANAFGDRYVYSLCPSSPDARAYAVALTSDVTERYGVAGVSLETPGFLPYLHGYHHEFALVKGNRWLESQLGLCFCRHCMAGAKSAGIDVDRLKARVAKDVEAYLAGDVDFPADMAEAFWLADVRSDGDLRAFLDWRCAVVTSLVTEIRQSVRKDADVAVIPSVARPSGGAWYEGSDLAALAKAAGIVEVCFYERGPERVRADLFDVKRRVDGRGEIRGILRPAYPDFEAKAEFIAALAALKNGGVDNVAFYNWGHIREANFLWIAEGIAAVSANS